MLHLPQPFPQVRAQAGGDALDRHVRLRQHLLEAFRDDLLDGLPPRTRAMFYLYRLEKLKIREIADLYGISASAVEKQVAKALLHLTRGLSST